MTVNDCVCGCYRSCFYWHYAFFLHFYIFQFLICSLAFATFSVDKGKPENRLQLSFTLVLTAVAFKSVVNSSLPRISYLTYMVSISLSVHFLIKLSTKITLVALCHLGLIKFIFVITACMAGSIGIVSTPLTRLKVLALVEKLLLWVRQKLVLSINPTDSFQGPGFGGKAFLCVPKTGLILYFNWRLTTGQLLARIDKYLLCHTGIRLG